MKSATAGWRLAVIGTRNLVGGRHSGIVHRGIVRAFMFGKGNGNGREGRQMAGGAAIKRSKDYLLM